MALQPVLGPSCCQDFFPSLSSALLLQPLIPRFLRSSSTSSNHLSLGLPARLLPSGYSKVSFSTGFSSGILRTDISPKLYIVFNEANIFAHLRVHIRVPMGMNICEYFSDQYFRNFPPGISLFAFTLKHII